MLRTSEETSPSDARIAVELQASIARLVRRLRQTHVPGDLTPSESSVLSRLDRGGPASPGDIAAGEQVRPQAMTGVLANLEGKGLIVREPDPADGRRVVVSATDAARQLISTRRGLKADRLAHAITGGFTPAEKQQLVAAAELLDRLAATL